MIVQTFYGYVSKSLGLLSDSVHMFFDCVALLVGLAAAVMSKWPPDLRFPYGYGMIDTLAGFANGVFLMLISLEIMYEAVERLVEGVQMQRITELLVVSTLGLAVNCVGMLAFGHAHHGHGHDHGHDHHHHDHEHTHGDHHDHQHHPHDRHHEHPNEHADHSHAKSHHHHGHSHHDSHGNENLLGIWLHILADTLGSAAVVVSTLLVQWTGWPGFDPLASCLIAILIFASAVPLVTSTAKRLLLTVPEATEFDIRDAIAGVSELRGIVGVTSPRVWVGGGEAGRVQGVMHIIVNRDTNLDEARSQALEYLHQKDMDVLVQVEREGDSRCWCGAQPGK
jgi:solute carrier family 30 (zinc transporter), member 5/7